MSYEGPFIVGVNDGDQLQVDCLNCAVFIVQWKSCTSGITLQAITLAHEKVQIVS